MNKRRGFTPPLQIGFKPPARVGFSLLELLLVLTLLPIVSFALFANFSAGTRLWKVLTYGSGEEEANLFVQKASRDFENTLLFSTQPFAGDQDEVAWMTGIPARPELGGDRGIGRVRYFHDPVKRVLLRETRDLSQLFLKKPGRTQVLLAGVTSFSARYFVYVKDDQTYGWIGEIPKDDPVTPVAVRFDLTDEGGGRWSHTFWVPVGG